MILLEARGREQDACMLSAGSNPWACLAGMQMALGAQGFNCGEDESMYWQFGSMTMDALKTFQVGCWRPSPLPAHPPACSNQPE